MFHLADNLHTGSGFAQRDDGNRRGWGERERYISKPQASVAWQQPPKLKRKLPRLCFYFCATSFRVFCFVFASIDIFLASRFLTDAPLLSSCIPLKKGGQVKPRVKERRNVLFFPLDLSLRQVSVSRDNQRRFQWGLTSCHVAVASPSHRWQIKRPNACRFNKGNYQDCGRSVSCASLKLEMHSYRHCGLDKRFTCSRLRWFIFPQMWFERHSSAGFSRKRRDCQFSLQY